MLVPLTCPWCNGYFEPDMESPGGEFPCGCTKAVAHVTIPEGSNPEVIIDWVVIPDPDFQEP